LHLRRRVVPLVPPLPLLPASEGRLRRPWDELPRVSRPAVVGALRCRRGVAACLRLFSVCRSLFHSGAACLRLISVCLCLFHSGGLW